MKINVRKAKIEEADKLIDIYRKEGIDVNEDNLTKNVKRDFSNIDKDRIIWFTEIDEKVVGVIQLIFKKDEQNKANVKDVAMIHHLRVAKEQEGLGVASELNKTVENTAKEKGIKGLMLEVEKGNKKAIKIYEHWGYKYLREGKNPKEIVLFKNLR